MVESRLTPTPFISHGHHNVPLTVVEQPTRLKDQKSEREQNYRISKLITAVYKVNRPCNRQDKTRQRPFVYYHP